MGVHLNTISLWESAERTPGGLELAKLCRALAVPCETLHQALLADDPAPEKPASKRKRPPRAARKRMDRERGEGGTT